MPRESFEDIEMKFKNKLDMQMGSPSEAQREIASMEGKSADDVETHVSHEYLDFKKDMMPGIPTIYEKVAKTIGGFVKIAVPEEKRKEYAQTVETCYMACTPEEMYSFAIMGPVYLMLIGILGSVMIPVILGGAPSMFFIIFSLIGSVLLINPVMKYPQFLETSWKMKASNQMVLCIFYVVTYMRHTSNIEHGVDFAAQHLSPPLSTDLKKVLWDVETQKFESVRESLTHYLERWRESNLEFVEAFNLIQSSLYESSDERRIGLLDKSLDVMLEETYEKMLHYAQNLQGPITMLHMLGVIMPILGLVILPLVASFMDGIRWYHIGALYNVLLPIYVFYAGTMILVKRPTGYGDTDVTQLLKQTGADTDKEAIEAAQKKAKNESIMLLIMFLLIGFLPLLIGLAAPGWDITMADGKFEFLGYKLNETTGKNVGPYGLGATILSLMIPLGIGVSLGRYYKGNTEELIKVREQTKQLETEFASGLFQLGNRIGDGIPAELAFGKVSQVMEGTKSGEFFSIVSNNISRLGMGVSDALFNEKVGAITTFPSNMIRSSMKVLVESSKKGPTVASIALLNVARYIKEIHRVEERLSDLMTETIASMNQQISFMTPVISGIVVGITSMISAIIGKLQGQLECLQAGGTGGGGLSMMELMSDGIPTYYFQFVVGFYVVQLAYVLTILSNGIQNGNDDLNKRYMLSKNMVGSTMKYFIISMIIIFVFNMIATSIVSGALKGCT